MRILFITLPRSKSNWVASMASEFYKIPNLFEPYRELFALPHNNEEYHQITKTLDSVTSGVMKIEITQLSDRHNQHNIIDLSVFNLRTFDKIYTTARTSIVDMVCSHLIACKFDGWIFTSDTDIPKINRMTFDPSHRDSIISMHSCLADINTLNYVHDWLSINRIEYTPLAYESMDEYIKNNWGNVTQTQWSATGYDYSKIFTNYKLIGNYIVTYAKGMKR